MNDSDAEIIQKIDSKMGKGWTRKLANVLATDMALNADVTFYFEKFDSKGDHKYSSTRNLSKEKQE